MKKMITTICLIAAAVIGMTSCSKSDSHNVTTGNGNTTIYPPGTVPTNTVVPTTGNAFNFTGKINGANWGDKNSYYFITSTTNIVMDWDAMPAGYEEVGVEMHLYDQATHSVDLTPPIVTSTTHNYYDVPSLSTGSSQITTTVPGWLTVTLIPKTGSGRTAVTYTAFLYR